MNSIQYYDLRRGKTDLIPDGTEIELGQMFEQFNLNISESELGEIPITSGENREKWIKIFRGVIFCISGHEPEDKDVNLVIEMINKLEPSDKENLSVRFVFGTISYLTVGFGFKATGRSNDDVNTIADGARLISKLLEEKETGGLIPLCAHRESADTNKDQLVEKVDTESVQCVTNLLKGMIENSNVISAKFKFMQPRASARASLFVFPDIFIKYIENGKLSDFFALLEKHFQEMSQVIAGEGSSKVSFEIDSVAEFLDPVFKANDEIFGVGWQRFANWLELNRNREISKEIQKIAENVTADHIIRFMPTFSDDQAISIDKSTIDQNIEYAKNAGFLDEVQDSIEWFLGDGKLTLVGKSLYETMFYYLWGKISAEQGFIGLGFERDHDLMQTMSWALGYEQELQYDSSAPLLYARRTKKITSSGNFSGVSFRQFWRLSERDSHK